MKKGVSVRKCVRHLVGVAGFEPATPSSRTTVAMGSFVSAPPFVPRWFMVLEGAFGYFCARAQLCLSKRRTHAKGF